MRRLHLVDEQRGVRTFEGVQRKLFSLGEGTCLWEMAFPLDELDEALAACIWSWRAEL